MSGAFEALSGAKGKRVAGQSAQNIAERNAEVAEANAKAERIRANFEQIQQAKERSISDNQIAVTALFDTRALPETNQRNIGSKAKIGRRQHGFRRSVCQHNKLRL